MRRQRVNAHLFVTTECNLKCKHCYSYNSTGSKNTLSLEEMVNVVKVLCDNYDVFIDVEGGELFLHKSITKWLESLSSDERNRITITTNGTLYPEIQPEYLKQLDEFRVSIEGHTDELQNELRGIPLKPVLDNCAKWIEHGIPVVARTTLNKMNYRYITEYIDAMSALGFKRFSFYEFQAVGRGKESKDCYSLEEHDFQEIFSGLSEAAERHKDLDYMKLSLAEPRIPVVYQNQADLLRQGFHIEDVSKVPSITINTDRSIGICPWEPSGYKNMNIRNHSLAECVDEILSFQPVRHVCKHCTGIRIQYQAKVF